jgi:hypothetical protein
MNNQFDLRMAVQTKGGLLRSELTQLRMIKSPVTTISPMHIMLSPPHPEFRTGLPQFVHEPG